jgi:hypothetical protein
MLKQIIHPSETLVRFLLILQLQLSKPQYRHVTRLVEAVIVGEGRKTLADLYRLWVDEPDTSAVADFLRQSPWDEQDVPARLQVFVIEDLLARAEADGVEPVLWVSLDDTTHHKDTGTTALEAVDWVYDPKARGKTKRAKTCKGAVEVSVHVQMGETSYRFAFRLYLRERTVRRLNRQRAPEERLAFKSKYRLAREMLEELKALLPRGLTVYVLCDSWYASRRLLKYCRRQGWYVIGAIKSNRKLNGQRLDAWNQTLRHTRYTQVTVADRTYWVRILKGQLRELPFDVCVVISKRHQRDKHPRYYVCTDLNLSARAILIGYTKRWPVEVDYYDLKQRLGASDWRVQSFEATRKWLVVVHLALIFLQWRCHHAATPQERTIGAVIRRQRLAHAREVLTAACEQVLRTGELAPVLGRFIAA